MWSGLIWRLEQWCLKLIFASQINYICVCLFIYTPPPVFYQLIQPWWAEEYYSTNIIKTWSIVMSFHSHQIECAYFTSTGAIWLKTLYMFQFMTTFFTVSIATIFYFYFSLAACNLECLKCLYFTVCLFESWILKIIHSTNVSGVFDLELYIHVLCDRFFLSQRDMERYESFHRCPLLCFARLS